MYKTWLGQQAENMFWYPKLIELLPKDNKLIKMRDEIPFDEIVDIIKHKYCSNNWAPSKSLRKLIALEILKKRFGYSDRDLVTIANTDLAVMYFCGYEYPTVEEMDSSVMTKFRNKIDNETAMLIQDVALWKAIKQLHWRKKWNLHADTTCIPENIEFPTDTSLLKKSFKKLITIIQDGKKLLWDKAKSIIIRWKQKLQKAIRVFDLQRNKSQKQIQSMRKKLIKIVSKLSTKAQSIVKQVSDQIAILPESALKKTKQTIEVINKVVEQQKELIANKWKSMSWRIVSLHKDYVRPIFRGKAKNRTEFWAKVTMNLIGWRYVQIVAVENENTSDTTMPIKSVNAYEKVVGKKPKELSIDRGWHSPWNHEYCKENKIADWIQYKWKVPKSAQLAPIATRKRLAKERCFMEWFIWIGKRKYGLGVSTYSESNRIFGFICSWIAMNYRMW